MAPTLVGIGPTWLDRRQMGFKNPLGTKSHIYKQIYSNILPYGSWDHTFNNTYASVHGGVFCLEFSPEGSLLVAACEKRSILMFDPLTHKRIHSVENAHLDCVNCVKFLDSRSFATCSDDFTVALWDARNLNQKVRSLKGHSNWVKNIEYSPQDGLLVTSGFDGSILTWEMNTYRESGTAFNKVFSTNGLMRTCLTPDATKMVICTTGGYLIVIHNLNLNTLSQDLNGFKPNMYRLMQLNQTVLPIASDYTDLFRGQGKRNRVEFITDFPEGDDAEVVSSLQIHPDGHCAISRNVSNNEKSEWSCIHNIEERLSSDESNFTDDDDDDDDADDTGCLMASWPGTSNSVSTIPSYIIQHSVVENDRSSSGSNEVSGQHPHVSPSDVWEALVAIQEARIRRESEGMSSEMSIGHMFRRQALNADAPSRSNNPNRHIFVARILPNFGVNREIEESLSPQRNIQSNVETTDTTHLAMPRTSASAQSFFPQNRRKKLPVRHRYASLYRRSLVGLYDRTSILRKPIYNCGITHFRFKTLKTRYEMRRTRAWQTRPADIECPTTERGSPSATLITSTSKRPNQSHLGGIEGAPEGRDSVSTPSGASADRPKATTPSNDRNMLQPESQSASSSSDERYTSAKSQNETRECATVSSSRRSEQVTAHREDSHSGRRVHPHKNSGLVRNVAKRRHGSQCGEDWNGSEKNDSNSKVRNHATSPVSKKIHQNAKRLTHYVEEPNLGRGFIKELCVSPDGRIICSPFGKGIRLLSFSPGVDDIFHCYPPSPPIPLHELVLNIAHPDTVVSTKFSPVHNLLVSGCLSGKIVYYQPFL